MNTNATIHKHLMLLGMLCFSFAFYAQQLTHQVTFSTGDVEITQVNGYDMVRLVKGGFLENEILLFSHLRIVYLQSETRV